MALPRSSNLLRATLLAGVSALTAVSIPDVAHAAEPPQYPPASCTRAAAPDESRAAFVRGKTASDQSSYDEALAQLSLAYRLDCTRHGFLPAIALVLERQGNYDEAVRALELYLTRATDLAAGDRATTETKIKNLREEQAKRNKAVAAPPPVVPVVKPQVIVMREHTAGPWIVVGVGVAAVATGIVLHVVAPALPEGCYPETGLCDVTYANKTKTYTQPEQDDRRQKAGLSQTLPLAGTLTLVGGGVLVAGGLLWHFLEPTGPVSKDAANGADTTKDANAKLTAKALAPRLSPALAPGYAGLSLGGAF